MPYDVYLSDGLVKLVTVPDQQIIGPLAINAPSNCSLTLVGRRSSNFGLAFNTNFVWLSQNFANSVPPAQALQGQLWYNNTSGIAGLKLLNMQNEWADVATSDRVFTSTAGIILEDGINGDSIQLGIQGVLQLVKTDYTPRIVFSGAQNSTNSVTLQLSQSGSNPGLSINGSSVTTMADFSANVVENGYSYLPNGLLLQWGISSALPTGSNVAQVSVAFSKPFNNCFNVTANPNGSAQSSAIVGLTIFTTSLTDQGCLFSVDTCNSDIITSNVNLYWFAIGN